MKALALLLIASLGTGASAAPFDKSGIAKNAREEKIRARDVKQNVDAENARMAKLYREHVLGEKPVEGLVTLGSIAPARPVEKKEADLVAGD